MEALTAVLMRMVALCAFSAFCEMMISAGKLLSLVQWISGLLVVESAMELVGAIISMLRG